MAGIAARPGGAEADVLDPAVDAVKGEVEPARPDSLARQPRREVLRSAARSARARSAGSAIGSAKLSRTRRIGASPSGDSGSGRSSSAWSRRCATALAETAGERIARHRIKLADPPQPDPAQTRRRSAGSSRKASTGSGASAARCVFAAPAKAGRRSGAAKRARAQAAPSVPAIAMRCGDALAAPGGCARSAASAASPPHKWPQPVISILTPSVPSGAVHGL